MTKACAASYVSGYSRISRTRALIDLPDDACSSYGKGGTRSPRGAPPADRIGDVILRSACPLRLIGTMRITASRDFGALDFRRLGRINRYE